MPEIAEVETVRRTLKKMILNKKIISIKIIYPKMINEDYLKLNNIVNQTFKDILRIGKWLIFETNDYYLLSHLRMEGKYFIKDHNEELNKHEHVVFTLEDNIDLRYHDVRKFGQMILINKEDLYKVEGIKKQGIEPIDSNLNAKYLKDKLKRKIHIKTLLLDQTIISGLGNIYADEVLFASNINPLKLGDELNDIEIKNIVQSSNKIINKAIKMGGTTIKSYTSSLGVTGRFQQELKVHKRENEPCFVCGEKIIKIFVGGRSTYYCPICQK